MTGESVLAAIDDLLAGGGGDGGDAMRWTPPETRVQPEPPGWRHRNQDCNPEPHLVPGSPSAADHHMSVSFEERDPDSFEGFESDRRIKLPTGAWAQCSCGFRIGSADTPFPRDTVDAAVREHEQQVWSGAPGGSDAVE